MQVACRYIKISHIFFIFHSLHQFGQFEFSYRIQRVNADFIIFGKIFKRSAYTFFQSFFFQKHPHTLHFTLFAGFYLNRKNGFAALNKKASMACGVFRYSIEAKCGQFSCQNNPYNLFFRKNMGQKYYFFRKNTNQTKYNLLTPSQGD